MQVLPQGRNSSRLTALGLLLAALALVYVVFFHFTYVKPNAQASNRVEQLQEQLARYRAVSAQRGELTEQLEKVRRFQQTNDYFLRESNFNLAGAALANRLKQIVAANASTPGSCQVIATQTKQAREPERFERVTVDVRMRCDIEELQKVLYELESGTPLVFLDNVSLYQNRVRARGGGYRDIYLDVRFDMYGYIRQPGRGPGRST